MKRSLTAAVVALAGITLTALHLSSENDTASAPDSAATAAPAPTAHAAPQRAQEAQPHGPAAPQPARAGKSGCVCTGCAATSGKAASKAEDMHPPLPVSDATRDQWMALRQGAPIVIALPGGGQASGQLELVTVTDDGTTSICGKIQSPHHGRFVFSHLTLPGVAGEMAGSITFDDHDLAYMIRPAADGSPLLTQVPVDEVICRHYAPLEETAATATPEQATPEEFPADPSIPDYQNGIIPLTSLPGASGVLYLDFDGEAGPHTGWGDFDAEPSGLNNTQIRETWERVAEDFAPFNLNVTTDLAVFQAAPANSRMRCIITPTTTASPGAGGVAYVGSFNFGDNRPCWVFLRSPKSCAEAASHELGHTLGLRHDGTSTDDYYSGHGIGEVGWAPLMGVGYYRNVTQWSRGEYLDANNQQDDLAIILGNNNVDHRTDDHGSTLDSAGTLAILNDNSVRDDGVITTSNDVDGFRFTLLSSSEVTLNINPMRHGPNLDILAELVDDEGSVLVSDNPAPRTNASIKTTLQPGEYLLRVSGVGLGETTADGYSDYGSLGFYKISGSVPNAIKPERFDLAENPTSGQAVGTVTPRQTHGSAPIVFAITSGNASGTFAINPTTGELSVADAALIDYESLNNNYLEPAQFDLTVSITNQNNPALNESVGVVVTVTNVNEAPVLAALADQTILERLETGTEIARARATDPDSGDELSYAITAGNSGNAFRIDSTTGVLTINAPLDASTTPSFSLTIAVTDSGTPAQSSQIPLEITLIDLPQGYVPGSILQSYYLGISGDALSDLLAAPAFPDTPDTSILRPQFSAGTYGDQYGSVFRGYLIPAVSGDYTFWVAADDECELRLSTDHQADNATRIAYNSSWTAELSWDENPTQQSTARRLTAGQPYYVEMRFKEGGGGDHGAVAWQGPGIERQVIPGRNLAPFDTNFAPTIAAATFTVQPNTLAGRVIGTLDATDPNPQDTPTNFAITGGNRGDTFTIDPVSGALAVANTAQLINNTSFELTVEASDNRVPPLTASATVTINVSATTPSSSALSFERWDFLSGSALSDLIDSPLYPDFPDSTTFIPTFDIGSDNGDNYGGRVRGYIIPPVSGQYTFYIASDDSGSLLLSSDSSAANATQIASVAEWTARNEWDKFPSQRSAAITMNAGQRYYVEALVKESGGGDHLQVAWTGPGIPEITVIDGAYLEPHSSNGQPTWTNAPYEFTTSATTAAGTQIGQVRATDPEDDPLLYAIVSENANGAIAIHPNSGALTIANPAHLNTTEIILEISAQDDGNGGNFPLATISTTVTIRVPDAVVDSDGDAMDDAFELTHFGSLTASNGQSDSDGDGQSDLDEFKAGTVPTSAGDVLKIVSVTATENAAIIDWPSKPGKSYTVEYSSDLADWQPISTGQRGSGAPLRFTDTAPSRIRQEQSFYRVRVE